MASDASRSTALWQGDGALIRPVRRVASCREVGECRNVNIGTADVLSTTAIMKIEEGARNDLRDTVLDLPH